MSKMTIDRLDVICGTLSDSDYYLTTEEEIIMESKIILRDVDGADSCVDLENDYNEPDHVTLSIREYADHDTDVLSCSVKIEDLKLALRKLSAK